MAIFNPPTESKAISFCGSLIILFNFSTEKKKKKKKSTELHGMVDGHSNTSCNLVTSLQSFREL
jgi:hypothetical protein